MNDLEAILDEIFEPNPDIKQMRRFEESARRYYIELKRLAEIGEKYTETIKRLENEAVQHGGSSLEILAVAVDGNIEAFIETVYQKDVKYL